MMANRCGDMQALDLHNHPHHKEYKLILTRAVLENPHVK